MSAHTDFIDGVVERPPQGENLKVRVVDDGRKFSAFFTDIDAAGKGPYEHWLHDRGRDYFATGYFMGGDEPVLIKVTHLMPPHLAERLKQIEEYVELDVDLYRLRSGLSQASQ